METENSWCDSDDEGNKEIRSGFDRQYYSIGLSYAARCDYPSAEVEGRKQGYSEAVSSCFNRDDTLLSRTSSLSKLAGWNGILTSLLASQKNSLSQDSIRNINELIQNSQQIEKKLEHIFKSEDYLNLEDLQYVPEDILVEIENWISRSQHSCQGLQWVIPASLLN